MPPRRPSAGSPPPPAAATSRRAEATPRVSKQDAQSRTLLKTQRTPPPDKSIVELCEAELDRSPDDARAARLHFEIARAHETQSKDPALALKHYRQALEHIADHQPSIRGARRLLLAADDKAALPLFDGEARLTAEPLEKAFLLRQKAHALRKLADDRFAARECYEKAAALDPSNPSILKEIERREIEAEDWHKLGNTWERQANAVEDDANYRAALMVRRARLVEARLKKAELAAELYSGALELDPEAAGAVEGLKRLLFTQARWRDLIGVLEREAAQSPVTEVKGAALFRVSRLHSEQLGENRQAIAALLRAAELLADDSLILYELARLYQATGDEEALAGVLERIAKTTERTADRLDLHYRIAQLYERGQPDKATGWYEAALALSPSYVPAIRALDKLYRQEERWPSLVAMYLAEADATEHTTRRADGHARAADILEQHLDDREQAASHHARALGLVPDLTPSFKALTRLYAAMGQHHELIELYGRAIDRAPDEELAIAYLFKVGSIQEEALQDPAAAMAAYRRILALQAGHLGAIHALQHAAEAAERHDVLVEALDLEAGRTKDPARLVHLKHRAAQIVDSRLDDPEAALSRYRDVLNRDPGYAPVLTSLSSLYRRLGRYDDLLGIHERELTLLSDDTERAALLFRMGGIAEQRVGDESRALKLYRRAIEADTACRPAVNALTDRLRARGDWTGLVEVLEAELTTEAEPRNRASVAYRLGEIQESQLEQLGAAVRAYRKALEAVADYRPALDALARVLTESKLYKELSDELLLEADRTEDSGLAREALLRAAHVLEANLSNDERAVVTYEAIAHSSPEQLAPLLALEPLYRRAKAFDELAELYRTLAQLLTDVPARVVMLEQLALLQELHQLGDLTDQRKTLLEILDLEPNHRIALLGLERVALADSDYELLAEVDSRSASATDDPTVKAHHYTRLGTTLEASTPVGAVTAYHTALQHEGDSLAAIRGLARLAEALGDPELAVEAARRGAEWTADSRIAADLLVRSAHIRLQRLDARDDATADLERALEVSPGHAAAAERLTDLLLEAEKPDHLIDCLSRAAEATDDASRRLALWQSVALLHADSKRDLPAAIAALERVRKKKPDFVPVLMQLGDLYERNGQWKRAVESLERVIKLSPGEDDQITARMQLGRILSPQLGDAPAAIEHLEALLKLDAGHREALRQLTELRIEVGRLAEARTAAERLVEVSSKVADEAWAQKQLARIEISGGDRKAAAKALHAAVILQGPTSDAAQEYRKMMGRDEHPKRYVDALVEHLRKVSAGALQSEDLAPTYLELARAQYDDLGQIEDAIATLRSGLDDSPRHPTLWQELGDRLARAGRHAEAIEELRRLVAQNPVHTEGWRSLARTLQEQTRHVEAAIAIAPVLVVGEPTPVERNLEAKHRPRPGWAAPGSFAMATLQAISPTDPDEETHLLGLLGAMAEGLSRMYPLDEHGAAVQQRERLTGRSDQPIATVVERLARAFGFSAAELYVYDDDGAGDMLAEPGRTPTLVVPASVTRRPEAQQVFLLAQPLAHLTRGVWPAVSLDPSELNLLVAAAARTKDESYGAGELPDQHVALVQKRLLKEIPWLSRMAFSTAVERFVSGPVVDLSRWRMQAHLAARRAAAVLAGDLSACADVLRQLEGQATHSGPELVRSSATLNDILRFWFGDPALQLRHHAGILQ